MPDFPLQFNYIPYPLWRRRWPAPIRSLTQSWWSRWYAVEVDHQPPATARDMARYLLRWQMIDGADESSLVRALEATPAPVELTRENPQPQPASSGLLRLPAQWEPLEAVILTWPALYPPLWDMHAQMAEAISAAADVIINVPSPAFAQGVHLYLAGRSQADLKRVRFLHLPTDDLWVRDYGPIVTVDGAGNRVVVDAIFDPLPSYPQTRDNAMPGRWAAHEEIPVFKLDMHTEGGNIWSDGEGTLIMSDEFRRRDLTLTDAAWESQLRQIFDFQKLIVTPHLWREETGHVDLLVKLADATTVLIPEPNLAFNSGRLRAAHQLFGRETNAAGEPYRVFTLPTPPLYLNWFVYPVWRSYTNSLTVNGRVLVPVFGIAQDERALAVYQDAMPGYEIIPINCAVGANGGGAVHCLTKEVPKGKG
jgi:agmatine deiminase